MDIRAIDQNSVHKITSGQVVVDLQSAVKELVENSLDAGASIIDVRFQNYGLKSIEVVDNGCGIASKDFDSIALKHHTSKLSSFDDLSRVLTFGFRGEALSSLCALSDGFTVTTATSSDAPMGTVIDMDRNGIVRSKCNIARQRGTTVAVTNLFKSLPVRRKELERHTKREFQKALNLLHAYALVPCAFENKGVRLTVSNLSEGGRKVVQFKTDGSPSIRASVLAVWGSKALDNVVDLDLTFDVDTDRSVLRRVDPDKDISCVVPVKVQGLISKFAVGAGRTSVDRQFFFVNGRPYNPGKVQKAINEVYRTFNTNQSPFVIANVILPTNACDINVSPDKRTIFLHGEHNLVQALKTALEVAFSSARSTFDVTTQPTQQDTQPAKVQTRPPEPDSERGEKPQDVCTSSGPEEPLARNRTPSPPVDDARGRDDRIAVGVPHLLLEPDEEPELAPEPTLVAHPGTRKGAGEMIDRPRRRAPSEPLFFPESDEEHRSDPTVRVDKGKSVQDTGSGRDEEERARTRAACGAAVATRLTGVLGHDVSVVVSDKPRSVQTVLSTRGAAWNLRREDVEAGRERKRARLSLEGDRAPIKKKSFRSSLSQFLGTGNKALPDADEDGSSSDQGRRTRKRGDRNEAGEVGERGKGRKKRPRAGSDSSQGTVIVPSDDERAIDVDDLPSTVTKPLRSVAPPTPQDDAESDDISEEDWTFSSTLIGTDIPPVGKTVDPPSNARSTLGTDADVVTLRVNIVNIGSYYLDTYNYLSSASTTLPTPSSALRAAVSSANLDTAADDPTASAALSRIISKSDFERMSIVGQFNLGFIIVRKQGGETGDDDLFIVDQHAADEKWNFETLQAKTVMASQRLFRPLLLQFTAADEMVAVENMDVLKLNGFELEQVEEREGSEDEDGSSGRTRLQLVAQPISKDTVFDIKDLEELIHLMQDRPRGTMVRCSKVRAMFASRACRSSVMIGKALDKTRMTTIVRHMGMMDQPWNCPHGRPTMRHLSDLTAFGRYTPPVRVIDWEAYGICESRTGEARSKTPRPVVP